MEILEIFRILDFDLLKFYLLKIFIIINSVVYIRIRNFYLSLYNIPYNRNDWNKMEKYGIGRISIQDSRLEKARGLKSTDRPSSSR